MIGKATYNGRLGASGAASDSTVKKKMKEDDEILKYLRDCARIEANKLLKEKDKKMEESKKIIEEKDREIAELKRLYGVK
jgi:hypothetical protein